MYSFTDDSTPHGLIQGQDGNLYGTTDGYFYSLTVSGTFTLLHTYGDSVSEGMGPHRIIQGSNGNFYGTMQEGGTSETNGYSGDGTVFRITPAGVLTTLHNFNNDSLGDGSGPAAGLVQGTDGNFYGTTYFGGTDSNGTPRTGGVTGTAFKITPAGVFTKLHSFNGYVPYFYNDGANPDAPLIQGSDGNFYGTTYDAGSNGWGTVFKITASGAESVLTAFPGYGSLGSWVNPAGPVMQGSDGNFYGTTPHDGFSDFGSVYRVTPAGTLTVLHWFAGTDGMNPTAGLVQTGDGTFYGTTPYGGDAGYGTVFQMTADGTVTTLYSFSGGSDGGYPQNLLLASDGNLYTTTLAGGDYGYGAIVRVNLPNPPRLSVASVGNQVILFWPVLATNYVLQTTANLATGPWVPATNGVATVGDQYVLTNNASGAAAFYRLSKPNP